MRILVLSRNTRLYSTRRLVEAARQRKHKVRVIDFMQLRMHVGDERPALFLDNKPLVGYDAVIPRIGASRTAYGTAVVRQFEAAGVYTLNSADGIARSRDKLRATQLMAGAGIEQPLTAFSHSGRDISGLVNSVGGPPVVIKITEGTQGAGVLLAETYDAAESVISAFRMLDAHFLVQEYIKEARGADIRAFVVGGNVIAAMIRQAPAGKFRSNLHRGGSGQAISLTPAERNAAVRAAATMGLNVAGVDLLRGADGPLLLEVNSSPGLEGIEACSGVDIAARIVDHIEQNVTPLPRKRKKKPRATTQAPAAKVRRKRAVKPATTAAAKTRRRSSKVA